MKKLSVIALVLGCGSMVGGGLVAWLAGRWQRTTIASFFCDNSDPCFKPIGSEISALLGRGLARRVHPC